MSSAAVRHLPYCTMLLDQTDSVCRPRRTSELYSTRNLTRHVDGQRQLVHIEYKYCKNTCAMVEVMALYYNDILKAKVPPGRKFMKDGLYPILAGYASNSQPTYYAELHYWTKDRYDRNDCMVEEGMTPADALVHNHVEVAIAPEEAHYEVPVLRYAPETYPRRYGSDDFMSGKDDGIDATGPYSWRPAGRLAYEDVGRIWYKLLTDPSSGQITRREPCCVLD